MKDLYLSLFHRLFFMFFENRQNGLLISDFIQNHLISRLYIGYTKKEAISLFNQYKKEVLI